MGERNVTFMFMAPALKMKVLRVDVYSYEV